MRDGRTDASLGHDRGREGPAEGTFLPWRERKGAAETSHCSVQGGAPAISNKSKGSGTRFSYKYAEEYPDLRFLPAQLCHFAHEYLRSSLGLPQVPEAERDINGVLDSCLVRDKDGADIVTFGGVAIRSPHHKGTVRVRSRPFASDKFFGRNPQVPTR